MPKCFACEQQFFHFDSLIYHFKAFHNFGPGHPIRCVEEDACLSRYFMRRNTFKNHFFQVHSQPAQQPEVESDLSDGELDLDHDFGQGFDPDQDDDHDSVHDLEPDNEDDEDHPYVPQDAVEEIFNINESTDVNELVTDQCARYSSKMNSNPSVTRKVCQDVIDDTSDLISTCAAIIKAKVMHYVTKAEGLTDDDRKEINLCFSAFKEPFRNVKSEHLRIKYFTKKGVYNAPKKHTIGQREVHVRVNGEMQVKNVDATICHIPLRKTLQSFLEHKNMLNDVLNYMDSLYQDGDVLSNIIQGATWKKTIADLRSKGDTKIYIPLMVYSDEYQTSNLLSPHQDHTKLNSVYATIPCLPPSFQSCLNSIFLCQLFRASDRKTFGNEKTFNVFINELNFLRHTGIEVKVDTNTKETKRIYFITSLLAGDNLGIHQNCGFIEGFSANHPCRKCRIGKCEMHQQCTDDSCELRDETNYATDLAINDQSVTGISEWCVFNRVFDFHATTHIGIDGMHDILEGTASYVLVLTLNYFLDAEYFSFETLCLKVDDFNYGLEVTNRPPPFAKAFSNNSLSLSAAEMLVLIRYLPLIIGDLVPPEDEAWGLFLSLRELVMLFLAPELQPECSALFKTVVEEVLQSYLKLSNSHLVFKFHILTHYHRYFLEFGPLLKIWCMRFEAKHRPSKRAASVNCCYRNIPLTLAIRHQLAFCDALFSDTLFRDCFQPGPSEPKRLTDFHNFNVHADIVSLDLPPSCLSTNWIILNGTKYKKAMILLRELREDLPQFAQIKEIIFFGDNVACFVCQKLKTISFEHHYQAYHVDLLNEHVILKHESLLSPLPLSLSEIPNRKKYVTLRHHL